MSFLSAAAHSNATNRKAYSIEEDRVIVLGLEEGETVSAIVKLLESEGFERSVLSVRYRVGRLREVSEKYDTLEAFHKK